MPLAKCQFYENLFFRLGKDDIVLEIFFAGGGAWFHGVRQLFPAPQHQCDPPSDLPPGEYSIIDDNSKLISKESKVK